jgi:SH3-like domain-containing protein
MRLFWYGSGLITAITIAVFVTCIYVAEERPKAVVVADVISVMSGPDDSYLELYRLFSAAEMRVLEERGEWARVVLPDGRQGWIDIDTIAQV